MRPLLAAVALLLLAACGQGGDVRDALREQLGEGTRSGEVQTWQSPDPVGTVTARIVDRVEPVARRADGGAEFLRYDDDVVIVSAAPSGGSRVEAEDLDGRYRGGVFAYLGPGFSPGSPAAGAGDGGPGDAK